MSLHISPLTAMDDLVEACVHAGMLTKFSRTIEIELLHKDDGQIVAVGFGGCQKYMRRRDIADLVAQQNFEAKQLETSK